MTELNLNVAPRTPTSTSTAGAQLVLAPNGLYLDPHQTRDRAPTAEENAIGDVIERCYAAGVTDCDTLVAELNKANVAGPGGTAWSIASFEAEMKRLGA